MHPSPLRDDALFEPGGLPHFVSPLEESALHDTQTRLTATFPGAVIRTLRGHLCRDERSFLQQFAAAFQFPHRFEETWNALTSQIASLRQARVGAPPHLLLISRAADFLAAEPPTTLRRLLEFVGETHAAWSLSGSAAGQAPSSFRLVLQETRSGAELLRNRLAQAGANWVPERLPTSAHWHALSLSTASRFSFGKPPTSA